ncbi:MAG: aminomethyl-transferring glycine dehydrogenase subunit GcvPB, partial [bacterium]|nr:aminomethyl-transferring glycine dehydrogenase subunit GcvPB [bacterium]
PGAGPVGVVSELAEFLPVPLIEKQGEKYVRNYDKKQTIGKVSSFYGNFSVLLRAYTYILMIGRDLRKV